MAYDQKPREGGLDPEDYGWAGPLIPLSDRTAGQAGGNTTGEVSVITHAVADALAKWFPDYVLIAARAAAAERERILAEDGVYRLGIRDGTASERERIRNVLLGCFRCNQVHVGKPGSDGHTYTRRSGTTSAAGIADVLRSLDGAVRVPETSAPSGQPETRGGDPQPASGHLGAS